MNVSPKLIPPRSISRSSVCHIFSCIHILMRTYIVIAICSAASVQCAFSQRSNYYALSTDSISLQSSHQMLDGLIELRNGRLNQATRLLSSVFAQNPSFTLNGRGTVAFWLGKALEQKGDSLSALTVWEQGTKAMLNRGQFDAPLASVLIRRTFALRHTPYYAFAADLYLTLLANISDISTNDTNRRTVLPWHLEPLLFVLSETDRIQLGFSKNKLSAELIQQQWKASTSDWIIAWWHRQDPLPSTVQNERLIEHLLRVGYAWKHYQKRSLYQKSYERDEGVLDARGEIYVRYGPPFIKRQIDKERIFVERFDIGLILALRKMPDIVIWTYPDISDIAHFLFIRRQNGDYEQSLLLDSLPMEIRRAAIAPRPSTSILGYFGPDRSSTKVFIEVLHGIYQQLAYAHGDYDFFLQDIISAENLPPNVSPSAYMASKITTMTSREWQMNRLRDQSIDQSVSQTLEGIAAIETKYLMFRSLEKGNSTKTRIYWTFDTTELKPTEDQRQTIARLGQSHLTDYLVRLTAVQQRADYTSRAYNQTNHVVTDPAEAETRRPVEVTTLLPEADTTGLYHVALQWDEFLAEPSNDEPTGYRPRGQLRLTTARMDSLTTLSADPSTLEMSDLLPVLPAAEAERQGIDGKADTAGYVPYPFHEIKLAASPLLYLEVYHLAYGSDDRTHYTVEVEVNSREGRFLLKDRAHTVSARTSYTGNSRKAAEYVGVDLSGIEGADTVNVVVRVTDEVTGKQVERAVEFEVSR